MHQPEFAGRKLHVEFQPMRAQPDTGVEREQRVLRRMAARTAMADDGERTIVIHLRAPVRSRRIGASSLADHHDLHGVGAARSEEHTSELQSLMRISYAVFCLKKKKQK